MIHAHQFPHLPEQPRPALDRVELLQLRLELLLVEAELEMRDKQKAQGWRFWGGLAAGLAFMLLLIF